MVERLRLGDIPVEVVLKDIKNIHLSVYPPNGRVQVSAPTHMSLDTIRVFVVSKLGWIKRQQKKFHDQERETPREYLEKESHYVWGRRYLLNIIEGGGSPRVELGHRHIRLRVPFRTSEGKRQEILEGWYRNQLKEVVPSIIRRWEKRLGVNVDGFYVRRMKTKWGSCNPRSRTIRLNTELAKKPKECLEYIVIHEMIHLLEPSHNQRFFLLMDRYVPKWQFYREMLNRLPVRHESWQY